MSGRRIAITFRLSASRLAHLDAIAVRERLLYGGLPSKQQSLDWLIDQDQKKTPPPSHDGGGGRGSESIS